MEGTIVTSKKKSNKNLIIAAIITTLTLVGGLAAGILLVGQRQLFRQKASVSGGVAKIYITPESNTINVGDVFSAKVYFDSGSIAVSAMTVQLEYSYSGSEPPISATDVQINSGLIQNNWDFPSVLKTITTSGGKVVIRFAGFSNSISGYTTTGQEELATITFSGNSQGTINVSFNPTESKMTKKSDGTDTLMIPQSTGTYTVSGGGSNYTPTPTATPGPTNSGSPLQTLKPVPTATKPPIPVTGDTDKTYLVLGTGFALLIASIIFAF